MKKIFFILFLLWANPALATEVFETEFLTCAELVNVSPYMIKAIAIQESGLNPYAVNVAGKSYLPKTKEEAIEIIETAKASNKSYDVGLMQVNSWWLKKFNISTSQALDVNSNIILGAFILRQEIQRYGLTWKAVAAYHHPLEKNPQRGLNYALNVAAILETFIESN